MITAEIRVPLLNANEPEARIIDIHVKKGERIEIGETLFTIETTKAAMEIDAPEGGFFHPLVSIGDTLPVGDLLAILTDQKDENAEISKKDVRHEMKDGSPVTGSLRITNPARRLAEFLKINMSHLPTDRLVTEEVVRQIAEGLDGPVFNFPETAAPKLIIYGGGGHAKTVIDLIRQIDSYSLTGIVDDNPLLKGKQVLGVPILGGKEIIFSLRKAGISLAVNCVGGILDINVRVKIFDELESAGFTFPNIIHPHAIVEESAHIEAGTQVLANAYVGSDAVLDPRCMINTSAVVSHDCRIGAYSHIAPGALLAGEVQVGERTLVGMGVTTAIGVKIGAHVRIGNGAIILSDVPDRTIIQAGRYWVGKVDTTS